MSDNRSRTFLALAVLSAAGFAACGLTACDRTDHNQEALDSARATMARISVAGATPYPGVKPRTDAYRKVLDTLKGINDSADSGQSAAAQLLIARAHGGLGEIAAQKATDLEGGFLNDTAVGRAVLDQWIGQNSVADALKAYDPQPDLDEMDRQIGERTFAAQKIEEARRTVESKAIGLRQQVGLYQTEARTLRDADTAARANFASMTQTARSDALDASAQQRRDADLAEKNASLFLAEIATLEPVIHEHTAAIERLHRQADLLRQNQVDLRKRREDDLALAATARSEATAVGQKLDTLLTALVASRETVNAPTKEAVAAYAAAVSAAKKGKANASREGQATLAVTAGGFEQARGDVLAMRSRGLQSLSELMRAVANAQTPLPNAPSYKTRADALATEADAAREEVKKTYESAASLFQAASGGSAEVKARLDELRKRLNRLAEKPEDAPKPTTDQPAAASDAPASIPAPATPAPGDKAPTAAPPAPPAPQTPAPDAKPVPVPAPTPKPPGG